MWSCGCYCCVLCLASDEEEEKYSQEELARLKECIISAMELVR